MQHFHLKPWLLFHLLSKIKATTQLNKHLTLSSQQTYNFNKAGRAAWRCEPFPLRRRCPWAQHSRYFLRYRGSLAQRKSSAESSVSREVGSCLHSMLEAKLGQRGSRFATTILKRRPPPAHFWKGSLLSFTEEIYEKLGWILCLCFIDFHRKKIIDFFFFFGGWRGISHFVF